MRHFFLIKDIKDIRKCNENCFISRNSSLSIKDNSILCYFYYFLVINYDSVNKRP